MRPTITLRIAIACSLLAALSGCDKSPWYQMAAAHGSSGQEDRVWVLDTESGRVSLCYEASARIACVPQSEPSGKQSK